MRIFTPIDRVRLSLILRGKRLGFSIAEIRELFELYDVSRDEKKQLEEFLAENGVKARVEGREKQAT